MQRPLSSCIGLLLTIMCVLFATGGCAVYRNTRDEATTPVLQGKLETLEKGQTSREEILEALGKPTRILEFAKGRERLVYEYEWRSVTHYNVLFLFSWDEQENRTSTLNFEIADGVLTRYWKEITSSHVEEVDID